MAEELKLDTDDDTGGPPKEAVPVRHFSRRGNDDRRLDDDLQQPDQWKYHILLVAAVVGFVLFRSVAILTNAENFKTIEFFIDKLMIICVFITMVGTISALANLAILVIYDASHGTRNIDRVLLRKTLSAAFKSSVAFPAVQLSFNISITLVPPALAGVTGFILTLSMVEGVRAYLGKTRLGGCKLASFISIYVALLMTQVPTFLAMINNGIDVAFFAGIGLLLLNGMSNTIEKLVQEVFLGEAVSDEEADDKEEALEGGDGLSNNNSSDETSSTSYNSYSPKVEKEIDLVSPAVIQVPWGAMVTIIGAIGIAVIYPFTSAHIGAALTAKGLGMVALAATGFVLSLFARLVIQQRRNSNSAIAFGCALGLPVTLGAAALYYVTDGGMGTAIEAVGFTFKIIGYGVCFIASCFLVFQSGK